MSSGRDDEASSLAAEWRRLRRAAVFLLACVAVVVIAGMVGLYH